jgi:hypothetical protein
MKYKKLTVEELEFMLPLSFQRKELIKRPCGSRCPLGDREETVEYEQRFLRFDSFTNNRQTRTYEISYRNKTGSDPVYRTDRHNSFRDALIEMYEILLKAGIISPAGEKEAERETGN